MGDDRQITKEEMISLKKAFLSCRNWNPQESIEGGEKLYKGEAEGWMFAIGEKNEEYIGYAWHLTKALEVPLTSKVAAAWFDHARALHMRSS